MELLPFKNKRHSLPICEMMSIGAAVRLDESCCLPADCYLKMPPLRMSATVSLMCNLQSCFCCCYCCFIHSSYLTACACCCSSVYHHDVKQLAGIYTRETDQTSHIWTSNIGVWIMYNQSWHSTVQYSTVQLRALF